MKRWTWIASGVALLVLGLSMVLFWPTISTQNAVRNIADRVSGLLQRPAADPDLIEAAGRLEAQEFDIAAKSGGRIVTFDLQEGDVVTKGDTIAKLDTLELQAVLRRTEAELLNAREGLKQADAIVVQSESDVALKDAELRRVVMLRGRSYQSGAEFDLKKAEHDRAEAALLLAQAQQRAASAGVAMAEAEMQRVNVALTDMHIVSPVSGRALYKLADLGSVVSPGQRIATLLDLSDVYITIFLPMEQAGRLAIGDDAVVTLDAIPTKEMSGRVSFISPRAQFTPKTVETKDERSKFMFRVKVRIIDAKGVPLNPGLPAVARIRLTAAPVSVL